MPRQIHFIINNNPIGKDRLEDVKPRGKWQFTVCEGGTWHELEQDLGDFQDSDILQQVDKARTIFIHNFWILPITHGRRTVLAHSIKTPDGREWDVLNGWRQVITNTPEGGVAGPQW